MRGVSVTKADQQCWYMFHNSVGTGSQHTQFGVRKRSHQQPAHLGRAAHKQRKHLAFLHSNAGQIVVSLQDNMCCVCEDLSRLTGGVCCMKARKAVWQARCSKHWLYHVPILLQTGTAQCKPPPCGSRSQARDQACSELPDSDM